MAENHTGSWETTNYLLRVEMVGCSEVAEAEVIFKRLQVVWYRQ